MKKAFTFSELMISLVIITVLSAILYPTVSHFTPNSNKPLCKSAYKILSSTISSITNSEDRTDGQLPLCTLAGAQAAGGADAADTRIDNNNSCNNDFTTSATALCTAFCERTNVISTNTCANECNDGVLITSNGMTWRFNSFDNAAAVAAGVVGATPGYTDPNPQGAAATIRNVFQIYVDVNSSNNTLASVNHINIGRAQINGTDVGVFYYPAASIVTTPPNYTNNPPTKAVYNRDNLKAQDTFEFLIDREGNIVSMSPAVYANLEDDMNSQH